MKNQLDDIWFWWYDESIRLFLMTWYYSPMLLSNLEDVVQVARQVSLNGVRLGNVGRS